jgi:putative oxidoreductase
MKKLILLLGRICLSLIFVSSATSKLFSWDATVHYVTSAFSRWTSYTAMPDMFHQAVVFLSSYAVTLLITATIFEGVGGLCVLFGLKIRFGATLLILFIMPMTIIMHSFWMFPDQERELQMMLFMRNLSILGGLLILAATSDEEV